MTPRLHNTEKSANDFYGQYKGHTVLLGRSNKNSVWGYTVIAPDGTYAADGYTKEPMTVRDAIKIALRSAALWNPTTP